MRHQRGTGILPAIASLLLAIGMGLLFYQVYNGVEEPKVGSLTKLKAKADEKTKKADALAAQRQELAQLRLALSGGLYEKAFHDQRADPGVYVPDAMTLRRIATDAERQSVKEYNESMKDREGFVPLPETPGYAQTIPAAIAKMAKETPALNMSSHSWRFVEAEFTVNGKTEMIAYYPDIRVIHEDMVPIIRASTEYLNKRHRERGDEYQQVHNSMKSMADAIKSDRSRIAESRTRLSERETEYTREIQRRDRRIAELGTELAERVAEFGNIQAKGVSEKAVVEKEIAVLAARITDLLKKKERMANETAADGEVIHVDESLGYVWIDLGHSDGMRNGLKFEVFSVLKGGRKQIKGMIEVREVAQDRSKASVIEGFTVYDPEAQSRVALPKDLNPIIRGDRVRSPFFNAEEQPVFVFIGDVLINPVYSKSDLTKKIEEIGGRVDKEITTETDFIIAVENAEEQPEFKKALQFGIQIIRERDLLKYLRR